MDVPAKPRPISVACSSKRQTHTLHRARSDFVRELHRRFPAVDVFGHGVRPMDDKAEAIDPYRCHVCIENHRSPHHWTEKLADPFLGFALPIYAGCPDADQDVPPESFVAIDLRDFEGSLLRIREAVEADEWSKRLEAIREARNAILHRHNLFAILSRLIEARGARIGAGSGTIMSRRRMRLARPWTALEYAYERLVARCRLRAAD